MSSKSFHPLRLHQIGFLLLSIHQIVQLDGANHIKSARLTSDFILSNQQSSSPSSSSRIAATTTTLIPEVVTVNGDNGGGVISTIAANVANNLPQRITVNPTTSSLASSSSFLSPSTLSELEKINQSFSNGFKSNTIGSNQTDPNISYDNNTNPENRLRWVDFGRHQGYPPRLPSIPGIPSGFRNPLATPPTTTSTQGFPLVASTTTTTTTTTTEASIEPIGMYDSGASFLTGSLGSNNLGFNINNPNLEDEIMFNVPNSNNMRRYNITRVEHIVAECSDEYMKVVVRFNGTFTGLIYSSGYVHDPNCIYVNGSGRNYYEFFIRLNQCGTLGRQEMYHPSMPGEARRRDQLMWNTLSIQYNAMIEEEFDEHFRLTCEYGSDFWKTVSFPGVNVEINTGSPVVFTINPPQCQMEIRRGFGIAGTRTSGPVTVGDPLTLLIHMKSDKVGFDILVKNCIAHNGAAQRMQLIDSNGCVTNDKLISPFRGTYNAENGHQVSLFAYLKAFRFTGSLALYLECDIHMCHNRCPPQRCYWRNLSKRSTTLDNGEEQSDSLLSTTSNTTKPILSESISLFQALEVHHEKDEESFSSSVRSERMNDDLVCLRSSGLSLLIIFMITLMLLSISTSIFYCTKIRKFRYLQRSFLRLESPKPSSLSLFQQPQNHHHHQHQHHHQSLPSSPSLTFNRQQELQSQPSQQSSLPATISSSRSKNPHNHQYSRRESNPSIQSNCSDSLSQSELLDRLPYRARFFRFY